MTAVMEIENIPSAMRISTKLNTSRIVNRNDFLLRSVAHCVCYWYRRRYETNHVLENRICRAGDEYLGFPRKYLVFCLVASFITCSLEYRELGRIDVYTMVSGAISGQRHGAGFADQRYKQISLIDKLVPLVKIDGKWCRGDSKNQENRQGNERLAKRKSVSSS